MKKLLFFIVILLFARGVTFFEANANSQPLQFDNLLLGYELQKNGNLNQVLAVLVGPQGKAGAAGVAGKNGFVGLNSSAGTNGIDGAPGPVGPPGPAGPEGKSGVSGINGAEGVAGATGPAGAPGRNGATGPPGTSGGGAIAVISLPPGDTNCLNGGTKFIASDGSTSFACNGTNGGSSGRSFTPGTGSITVCDNSIDIGMISHFDTKLARFVFDGVRVMNMDSKCEGDRAEFTVSTTSLDGLTNIPFTCTVLSLPDPAGGDLYLTRPGYNLRYGESGQVVEMHCDPSLSTIDLTILDSIIGFQLS
jgi:hypothetical protein